MKRKQFLLPCLLIVTTIILTGCGSDEKYKQELQTEIQELENEIEELEAIRDGLISKDDISYIIEIEISQSHFTLDIDEHLKDSLNTITIPVEVSQEYYYSVEVGDTLNSDLRIGSAVFKGSFGSWDITVKDKETVENH